MESSGTTWDLAHLLTVLRRRMWWIVSTAVVAVVVSVALSMVATPVYHAEAQVLIEPEVAQTNPDALGRVFFAQQELVTQARLIHSEVIAGRVIDALSLGRSEDGVLSQVHVSLLPDSRVVRILAADGDPARAAQLAQSFADQYLEYRREAALDRVRELTATLQQRIDTARVRVDELDEEIDQESDPARLAVLRDDRRQAAEELAGWSFQLTRLDTAEVASRGGGEIIKAATVPARPAEPRPVRSAFIALILGLGVGVLLALARDVIDRRVRTVADAVETSGKPALGRVPLVSDEEGGDLPMLRHPSGPPAEAFRDLRTNLRFVGRRGAPTSVLVTSALQGEGKSVVAANLALAAAAAGQDVVLIDADLRRPAIARMLGLDRGPGLTSVLSRDVSLGQALLEFEEPAGLSVLLSGPGTPIPNELLGSPSMASLLERLTARFDLVVIDAPPVLVVPDALELATAADATLLVVELQQSTRQELAEVRDRLERVGGHVAGLVVNRADLDPMNYGYYYYDEVAG